MDEDAEEHAKELLKWWNEYVAVSFSLPYYSLYSYSRIFTGTNAAENSRGTKMTSRKEDIAKRQRRSPSPTHAPSPATDTSTCST